MLFLLRILTKGYKYFSKLKIFKLVNGKYIKKIKKTKKIKKIKVKSQDSFMNKEFKKMKKDYIHIVKKSMYAQAYSPKLAYKKNKKFINFLSLRKKYIKSELLLNYTNNLILKLDVKREKYINNDDSFYIEKYKNLISKALVNFLKKPFKLNKINKLNKVNKFKNIIYVFLKNCILFSGNKLCFYLLNIVSKFFF